MRLIRKVATFLTALVLSTPGLAADNTVTLTPGAGVTMRTQDVGSGVQSPYNILGNTSGTSIYGTAGTSNAAVLSVQGIASGTALPITGTVTAVTSITNPVAVTQSGTWTVQPGNTANTTPWLVTGSGSAGTAATGVLTVQGIASMTPLLANPGTAANWGVGATGSAVPANGVYSTLSVGGTLRGMTGLSLGSTFSQTVAIVDASGNQITSFGGAGGTASNYGSAFPATGTAVGFTDGTNMVAGRVGDVNNVAAATNYINTLAVARYNATQPTLTDTRYNALQVSARGELLVAVGTTGFTLTGTSTVTGSGSAGTAATGVLTVQGIASMTPLLANPGTAANWGVGATGSAVPANAIYNALNVSGTLRGVTGLSLGSTFSQTVAIVDGSGNQVTAFGGSGGTSSNYGSAFPSAGTAVGFTDGTNMAAARVGAASNATAATNYLDVLGICQYNSSAPTITDTRYNHCQIDVNGNIKVNVANATTAIGNNADGVTVSSGGNSPVANYNYVYNGTSWDRMRGTTSGVAVTAASTAFASGSLVDITNISVAPGSAPPSKAIYLGANGSGATGGFLKGLITCDTHAKYDASDNGSITMVTGVSGRKVYICGYMMTTGGSATNLKLREGSDSNCATNGADLTPAYQLVANDKIGVMSSFWTGLVVSTNAYYVCINASAGNAHQAELWYTIL